MDESRAGAGRVPAIVLVALVGLISIAALIVPYVLRREVSPSSDQASRSAPPYVPTVELWLSTADRQLKMAQQPNIVMTAGGNGRADINIDVHNTYQSMVGFGAAMTDASAWLLQHRLNASQREALMQELFGAPPGLNFNMLRLTIGASDFSLKIYTHDDVYFGQDDPRLEHFNLVANEDDLIPSVKQALAINPGMQIVASSWSAPAWMKTNQNLIGGQLLEQYENVYTDYLIKYLDAFRARGIPIAALTLQNEPAFEPITYPGMQISAETRARIYAKYLGPKLARRTPRVQLWEWDHNWGWAEQPLDVLSNPEAARYVDAVAWHCYAGSPYAQGRVRRAHPDKDVYMTECSGGDWAFTANGELLWFTRNLLIASIRQWARGIIYWNLALDENHGPHFGGCDACKGVVLIDSVTGEVRRNDEYYAIGHFSRFVLPDAVRVESTETDKGIDNVAFQNATDGSVVLVVVNSNTSPRKLSVAEGQTRFAYTMPAGSVATFVWSPDPAVALVRRAIWWLRRTR